MPESRSVTPAKEGGQVEEGVPAKKNVSAKGTTATARDVLKAYGIGPSDLKKLTDGQAIGDDEVDLLLRILLRLGDCRAADLQRWADREIDPVGLAADPGASRGEMFSLHGRIAQLETIRTPDELAERSGIRQYYRATLVLDDRKGRAVVYTRTIPAAWIRGSERGDRVSAAGMFLKLSRGEAAEPMPALAATRLAWHPATPLGELNVDVGLLDDVRDDAPLTALDREAFYGILAAMRQAKPGQLLQTAKDELKRNQRPAFSVVPLFDEPARQRGRLVCLSGTAGRVVRVPLDDPEAASRFGLDHYFEIDLFTADSQNNPLVVCVPDLPKGMPTGDAAGYREPVEVAGVFFKVWRYPALPRDGGSQADAGAKAVTQRAPLVIGQTPVWHVKKPPRVSMTSVVAGVLLALVLIGVWLLLWHLRQGDQEFDSLHDLK
jgi:hypothetical protein